ncbi:MAG TPA: hypothetical protein VFK02_23935 [Kofleriaceae bacterium]|nr:hypothetical protein [Kofleriaceae bacterium]
MVLALVVLVAAVPACHLRAGLDAASRTSGPLHTLMMQSSTARDTGVVNLPPANTRNYALEAGFGSSTLTINGLAALHEVNSTSFTPGAGYLSTTLGANVRWAILHWHGLEPSVAAGPARVLRLDRASGDSTWGNAVRFGAGAQYRLGPIALYGDLYREVAAFGDGAAQGTTTIDGLTLGLAIEP